MGLVLLRQQDEAKSSRPAYHTLKQCVSALSTAEGQQQPLAQVVLPEDPQEVESLPGLLHKGPGVDCPGVIRGDVGAQEVEMFTIYDEGCAVCSLVQVTPTQFQEGSLLPTLDEWSVCDDEGESSSGPVSVLEGESGWISCPVSGPTVQNASSTERPGLPLDWYQRPSEGREQPVSYSSRVSRDAHQLWFQPSALTDSGLYVCWFRDGSSCRKRSVRLQVLPRRASTAACHDQRLPVAMAASQVVVPLQMGGVLDCPDLAEAARMSDGPPSVTWYKVRRDRAERLPEGNLSACVFQGCRRYPFWRNDIQPKDEVRLQIHSMMPPYSGVYFCRVHYQRRGGVLNFTRSLNVTAVSPPFHPKHPSVLHPPNTDLEFHIRLDSEVRLACKGLLPFLESPSAIWWTVDGTKVDELADPRYSETRSSDTGPHQDKTVECVLVIRQFRAQDLDRTFNCCVANGRGFDSRQARLLEEARVPVLELGCGLGAGLVLVLLLFLLCHVYWLELVLIYRTWFGADEYGSGANDKDYDVYISYSRNSEEEEFVLSTLRRVLESELGYSVCIFDRDSLPGGTITDETLGFVARSRRVLVVLSPGYASQGTQALLELKAGIDGILGGHLRVILVQYKPVRRQDWVRELRAARVALALVCWRGDESRDLASGFWKRLRVELPVQRERRGGGKVLRLLSPPGADPSPGPHARDSRSA
ncbi:LOW QUALITY PROTEIN: interleukin-1 receptor accessory protein-like [Neosynchiropus ocellatus]